MFDLALADTGDWIFSANRDIAGATGENVIRQRIITRLRTPRGTIRSSPLMGSRLHEVHKYDERRAIREIPALVQDALAPMEDISITQVEVIPRDVKNGIPLQVRVGYAHAVGDAADYAGESNEFSETFRVI